MLGHNGYSFDDVVQENLERGLYWAQRDCLIRAIRDPELSHRHRIVVAEIIAMTNADSGVAYPGRKHLAAATGYTEGTIATTVKELVAMGYLVSDRRAPSPGSRAMAHYSIVKPTADELRAAIDAHIAFIRAAPDTQKQAQSPWPKVNPVVHVNGADVNPGIHVNGCSDVNPGIHVSGKVNPVVHVNGSLCSKAEVNPVVPTVTSSESKKEEKEEEKKEKKPKQDRGTRLPSDWKLPKSWGDWALAEFAVTEQQVRREADNFRDFWISKPGAAACKLDWFATWRTWVRRCYPDKTENAPPRHAPKAKGSVMMDAINELLAERGND